jgi:hypothetical protein
MLIRLPGMAGPAPIKACPGKIPVGPSFSLSSQITSLLRITTNHMTADTRSTMLCEHQVLFRPNTNSLAYAFIFQEVDASILSSHLEALQAALVAMTGARLRQLLMIGSSKR